MIQAVCSNCKRVYRLKDKDRGKAVNCGTCGWRVEVPLVEQVEILVADDGEVIGTTSEKPRRPAISLWFKLVIVFGSMILPGLGHVLLGRERTGYTLMVVWLLLSVLLLPTGLSLVVLIAFPPLAMLHALSICKEINLRANTIVRD